MRTRVRTSVRIRVRTNVRIRVRTRVRDQSDEPAGLEDGGIRTRLHIAVWFARNITLIKQDKYNSSKERK